MDRIKRQTRQNPKAYKAVIFNKVLLLKSTSSLQRSNLKAVIYNFGIIYRFWNVMQHFGIRRAV